MMTLCCLVALGAVAVLATPSPSGATDALVTGAKVKIVDVTQPGGARRKIVFVSLDPAVDPSADASGGDPSLHGGSLRIVNTAGSGESQVLPLPAGNWRRIPRDLADPLTGWKYREVVATPPAADYVIKVVLKQTSSRSVLRAVVKDDRGSLIAYTLDEPVQGSVAIQVSTGADRHCTDFGGTIVDDASDDLGGDVYRGTFVAKLAPAPGGCASPSGAFLD